MFHQQAISNIKAAATFSMAAGGTSLYLKKQPRLHCHQPGFSASGNQGWVVGGTRMVFTHPSPLYLPFPKNMEGEKVLEKRVRGSISYCREWINF
jgi:hypothetical protein